MNHLKVNWSARGGDTAGEVEGGGGDESGELQWVAWTDCSVLRFWGRFARFWGDSETWYLSKIPLVPTNINSGASFCFVFFTWRRRLQSRSASDFVIKPHCKKYYCKYFLNNYCRCVIKPHCNKYHCKEFFKDYCQKCVFKTWNYIISTITHQHTRACQLKNSNSAQLK